MVKVDARRTPALEQCSICGREATRYTARVVVMKSDKAGQHHLVSLESNTTRAGSVIGEIAPAVSPSNGTTCWA